MFIGAVLFVLIFIAITPQAHGYLASVLAGVTAFLNAWAPFSYLLLFILVAALCAGVYLIRSWPKRVEPENPMAKYLRDAPVKEE